MGEVALDALIDSAWLLPFLLIIYIILEVMEHNATAELNLKRVLGGRWDKPAGAALGIIPQCGFSVAATQLYTKRYISTGTLMAIYIAASDEALPVLLSNAQAAIKILPLFAIKFLMAVAVGYSVDLAIKSYTKHKNKEQTVPNSIAEVAVKTQQVPQLVNADEDTDTLGCGCSKTASEKEEKWSKIKKISFRYIAVPLWRTVKVWIFIFAINLSFGAIIFSIGEEAFAAAVAKSTYLQPLLACMVGLIPNCASSVVLTQLYAVNTITLGAAVAGLSVNAGIAPIMLFKRGGIKKGIAIMSALFFISLTFGYIITAIEQLI